MGREGDVPGMRMGMVTGLAVEVGIGMGVGVGVEGKPHYEQRSRHIRQSTKQRTNGKHTFTHENHYLHRPTKASQINTFPSINPQRTHPPNKQTKLQNQPVKNNPVARTSPPPPPIAPLGTPELLRHRTSCIVSHDDKTNPPINGNKKNTQKTPTKHQPTNQPI